MRCDYIGWLPVCRYAAYAACNVDATVQVFEIHKTHAFNSRYFNPISYHEMTLGLSIKPSVQHFFKTTYPVRKAHHLAYTTRSKTKRVLKYLDHDTLRPSVAFNLGSDSTPGHATLLRSAAIS